MKNWHKYLIMSFVAILFLSGCESDSNNEESIFQYKESYVGDNTAVINSIGQLPNAESAIGLELKTKEEPYGIIVNYDGLEADLNNQETSINNASYLFTLFQNLDWVLFNFDIGNNSEEYKFTRESLDEWYGTELSDIRNEDQLTELIQETLKEKSGNDLFD